MGEKKKNTHRFWEPQVKKKKEKVMVVMQEPLS